jgi:uncharacterized protein YegP (UPF0339 family)
VKSHNYFYPCSGALRHFLIDVWDKLWQISNANLGKLRGIFMAARYVLNRSGAQYRFVLKAGNNETILTSELYASKQATLTGIASVKTNSPNDSRYERKNAVNGQAMFNLKAANGERIGTSETYSSP